MRKDTYPTISVAIATYNSGKTLERCLKDIRNQEYDHKKIEIILGDGGSTDSTFDIAKKYNAKVIKIPKEKQNAEYNRGVAFNRGKGELSLILDHDNFLPSNKWLKQMVQPFFENNDLVATSTCYYHYSRKYGLMDRYFALFGTSEPLPLFLKKADRMMQTSKSWSLPGSAIDKGRYYLVEFEKNPRKFPSMGTNGCMMRRKLVQENAKADPENHYPIDVLYDMVEAGFNKFAFVKNSIIHLTHSRGFWEFIKRRKMFVEKYHFEDHAKRRWSVVMPGDSFGVFLYVLYSLSFVGPLFLSFRNYLKIRDKAWFVHPFMCLTTTFIYGWVVVKYSLKNITQK